jgi:hypothetical protein
VSSTLALDSMGSNSSCAHATTACSSSSPCTAAQRTLFDIQTSSLPLHVACMFTRAPHMLLWPWPCVCCVRCAGRLRTAGSSARARSYPSMSARYGALVVQLAKAAASHQHNANSSSWTAEKQHNSSRASSSLGALFPACWTLQSLWGQHLLLKEPYFILEAADHACWCTLCWPLLVCCAVTT